MYVLYIYIYIFFFFFFFEKQVKRIMSWTDNLKTYFQHGKNYRVWSLAGQGFLKLKLTGAPSADFSGTGDESSSNTKILLIVLLLSVQFPLIGVAIRIFCWLLIRYLKLFLFVFYVPFQVSNLPTTCLVPSLSGRSRERRSITLHS